VKLGQEVEIDHGWLDDARLANKFNKFAIEGWCNYYTISVIKQSPGVFSIKLTTAIFGANNSRSQRSANCSAANTPLLSLETQLSN
jgi:hypothetical protein